MFPTNVFLATNGPRGSMPVLGAAKSHIVPDKMPTKQIVNLMRDENIGSVVVGSRDLGRFRYAIGASVSGSAVREACCSVLVARDDSGA